MVGLPLTPSKHLPIVISQRTYVCVAALLWREHQLLLVLQQGPSDLKSSWALPGGVVNPGETDQEALIREVREETGLEVIAPGLLIYIAEVDDDVLSIHVTVRGFEITRWSGELSPADPDDLVREARFSPVHQAIAHLERHPSRTAREPVLAYLRGEAAPGALWIYHRRADSVEELLSGPVPTGPRTTG